MSRWSQSAKNESFEWCGEHPRIKINQTTSIDLESSKTHARNRPTTDPPTSRPKIEIIKELLDNPKTETEKVAAEEIQSLVEEKEILASDIKLVKVDLERYRQENAELLAMLDADDLTISTMKRHLLQKISDQALDELIKEAQDRGDYE